MTKNIVELFSDTLFVFYGGKLKNRYRLIF